MRHTKVIKPCLTKTWKTRLCESSLFRSWWVLLFLILSFSLYSHAMQKKAGECSSLKEKLHLFELEKQLAVQEHEDLVLQINSLSDPAWIQMTLMKGMGLVPEGQQKVYFIE